MRRKTKDFKNLSEKQNHTTMGNNNTIKNISKETGKNYPEVCDPIRKYTVHTQIHLAYLFVFCFFCRNTVGLAIMKW